MCRVSFQEPLSAGAVVRPSGPEGSSAHGRCISTFCWQLSWEAVLVSTPGLAPELLVEGWQPSRNVKSLAAYIGSISAPSLSLSDDLRTESCGTMVSSFGGDSRTAEFCIPDRAAAGALVADSGEEPSSISSFLWNSKLRSLSPSPYSSSVLGSWRGTREIPGNWPVQLEDELRPSFFSSLSPSAWGVLAAIECCVGPSTSGVHVGKMIPGMLGEGSILR